MKMANNNRFSQVVSVFHGKHLPERDVSLYYLASSRSSMTYFWAYCISEYRDQVAV